MEIADPINAIPPITVQNFGNGINFGTRLLIPVIFTKCPTEKLYNIIANKYIPIGVILYRVFKNLFSYLGSPIVEIRKKPPLNARTLFIFTQVSLFSMPAAKNAGKCANSNKAKKTTPIINEIA